jgi:hypothetical protein
MPIPCAGCSSTLHIDTADGRLVDDATITITAACRSTAMVFRRLLVTSCWQRRPYLVEGVKFNMGGWWVVRFAIASAAGTDTVRST